MPFDEVEELSGRLCLAHVMVGEISFVESANGKASVTEAVTCRIRMNK